MDLTEEEEELVREFRKKKKNEWKPRSLDSYTELEKSQAFDKFYQLAYSEYEKLKNDDYYEESDIENWCYEEVMKLLGKDVWSYVNSRL